MKPSYDFLNTAAAFVMALATFFLGYNWDNTHHEVFTAISIVFIFIATLLNASAIRAKKDENRQAR